MRSVRLAAIAALSSLAFISSAAQARGCWLPREAEAAQIRGLHLMLMAGTLQCRQSYWDTEGLFNDFVDQQREVLIANADTLKSRFQRESGPRWQEDSDRFDTALANLYSDSLDEGGYCRSIGNLARIAADSSRADLVQLAQSVADAPVSGACAPSGDEFGAGYDRERVDARRLPPKVALSDALRAPVPPVEVEQADVIVATAVPAPPEAAAAPVEVEAVEAPAEPVLVEQAEAPAVQQAAVVVAAAPAPAAPSREEALKTAIAALQSAVVALQAAGASGEAAKSE